MALGNNLFLLSFEYADFYTVLAPNAKTQIHKRLFVQVKVLYDIQTLKLKRYHAKLFFPIIKEKN